MSETDSIEEIKGLMRSGETATIEKILDKFIVKDKNLILKTDIENSIQFTVLKLMEFDLRKKGLKKSAKTLKEFTDRYVEVRVSRDRLSWKYILDAISAVKREESGSSLTSKLLGMNDKEKK